MYDFFGIWLDGYNTLPKETKDKYFVFGREEDYKNMGLDSKFNRFMIIVRGMTIGFVKFSIWFFGLCVLYFGLAILFGNRDRSK
jgi:hypothetical protein